MGALTNIRYPNYTISKHSYPTYQQRMLTDALLGRSFTKIITTFQIALIL